MKWSPLLLCCALHLSVFAQYPKSSDTVKYTPTPICNCFTYPTLRPLSTSRAIGDRTYRRIRNQTFSAIANGGDQAGSLATFGSFDPVAGNFKLNYTHEIPVGSRLSPNVNNSPCAFCNTAEEATAPAPNSLFFSLGLSGDLVGNNIGVLFDNSKFNSSTSITGKLFIPLQNSYMISGLAADALNDKKKQLEQARWMAKLKVWQNLDTVHIKTNLAYAQQETFTAAKDRQTLRKTIETLENHHDTPQLLDSLHNCLNRMDATIRDSVNQHHQIDSLDDMLMIAENRFPNPDYANYGFRLYQQIDTQYNRRLDSLELSIPYQPYSLHWLALVGSFNRNTYYTYDSTRPYAQQVTENTFSVFDYGLELNLIHFTQNAMHYLNAGLLRIRNNNIGDLTATAYSLQIKEPSGDTTQILTKNYNVFTSPITEYMAWKPYVNYYYFFGKDLTNQAIHLQAQSEFRNNGTNPVDLGLGYVFSFKNSKSNALLNAEAFICFNDVFKSLPSQESYFYNRNTIGLRFGLPVTLPNKSSSK